MLHALTTVQRRRFSTSNPLKTAAEPSDSPEPDSRSSSAMRQERAPYPPCGPTSTSTNRISGNASQKGLELHTFEGDECRTGQTGNARAPLADATQWWADWNAGVSISADATVRSPEAARTHAPATRRRRSVQVTSGSGRSSLLTSRPINGWTNAASGSVGGGTAAKINTL